MKDEQYDGMIKAIHLVREQLVRLEENQSLQSKWQHKIAEQVGLDSDDNDGIIRVYQRGWDFALKNSVAVWIPAFLVSFVLVSWVVDNVR